MAKGDKVTIQTRSGHHSMVASKAGRSLTVEIEKESGISWLTVKEVTRGGTMINAARFQMPEVVAYIQTTEGEE